MSFVLLRLTYKFDPESWAFDEQEFVKNGRIQHSGGYVFQFYYFGWALRIMQWSLIHVCLASACAIVLEFFLEALGDDTGVMVFISLMTCLASSLKTIF